MEPKLFKFNGAQVEADVDGLPADKAEGQYYRIDQGGNMYTLDFQGSGYTMKRVVLDERAAANLQIDTVLTSDE